MNASAARSKHGAIERLRAVVRLRGRAPLRCRPVCDELSPDDGAEDWAETPENDQALAPGERLFYALGQLYRLWRRGELDVRPINFDVSDLARIIGVASDIEFISEDLLGVHYHFPGEVLVVEEPPDCDFPWRLRDTWEWAAEQELNSFWTEDL